MNALLRRLTNLICIKNLVTIILTMVFAHLAMTGQMEVDEFLTIFTVIIAFYFGAESERKTKP